MNRSFTEPTSPSSNEDNWRTRLARQFRAPDRLDSSFTSDDPSTLRAKSRSRSSSPLKVLYHQHTLIPKSFYVHHNWPIGGLAEEVVLYVLPIQSTVFDGHGLSVEFHTRHRMHESYRNFRIPVDLHRPLASRELNFDVVSNIWLFRTKRKGLVRLCRNWGNLRQEKPSRSSLDWLKDPECVLEAAPPIPAKYPPSR